MYFARSVAQEQGLQNVTFHEGNLLSVPFASQTFDAIWTKYVLYFLREPHIAIAEFKRLLRPGGVVAVALNDWSGLVLDPPNTTVRKRLDLFLPKLIDVSMPTASRRRSTATFKTLTQRLCEMHNNPRRIDR